MGKSVLANQFVAGLRSEIKGKVVGMEVSFEELLVKARFEEAKLRDLAGSGGEKSKKVSGGPVEAGTSRSGSGIADKGGWVEARLQPPTLMLRNYGGGQLFLLRQIKVSLKRGDHAVE